jgi:hypothetical protein
MADDSPRRRVQHPRRWVALGVLAALLAAGGWFAFAWSNRGAHTASVNDAVSRFRETDDGGSDGDPAARLVPPAGVYTYEGRGREKLSVLGTAQSWGDTIPATVKRGADGCWTLLAEFNTHHSHTWRYCVRDGTLVEQGGTTRQQFDFVAFTASDVNVFTCPRPGVVVEPDRAVGASSAVECTGHSERQGTDVTSKGTNTFVGREKLTIGSRSVDVYHVRLVRKLSGDQAGDDRSEAWFSTDTAMLLKMTRDIRVTSPSPVGDVTYTEQGTMVLTSLEPRR